MAPARHRAGVGRATKPWALLRAAHAAPTVAVTCLATALAATSGSGPARTALIAGAVAAGQLSVGWSNDLIDRQRDEVVGRTDKPLATGELSVATVRIACAVAVVAAVVLSLACGVVAGLWHLLGVAAGWSYNLGVKATVWSWVPYAVGFGALTVFVVLASPGADWPPWWLPVAGALLGVGAHLVNVLPDLADDAATGIRGLPHRLGETAARRLAVGILCLASVVVVVGAQDLSTPVWAAALGVVGLLAVIALRGRGSRPFRAAIGIAVVDVLLLVMAG